MNTARTAVAVVLLAGCGAGAARGQAPYVGTTFSGTSINEAGFIPPDINGAVGPAHYVEMVNGRYRVYNKGTGAVIAGQDMSLNTFWTGGGGVTLGGGSSYDPRVQYDRKQRPVVRRGVGHRPVGQRRHPGRRVQLV